MGPPLHAIIAMVLLIGNYPLDRQESMLRFATMMLDGLTSAGVAAELIQPQPVFGNFRFAGQFVAKWLGYIDKFLLFPRRLKAKLRAAPTLVHICDHSNAAYTGRIKSVPVLITCHDLLAVRGGLGDDTDTPASFAGKFLQRWILAGLRDATAIVCDSEATCDDARRLVTGGGDRPILRVVTLGLSYPYQKLPRDEARGRIAVVSGLKLDLPFVLHVGSNLRRKNREGILRIFARCKDEWPGQLVFAGDPLSQSLSALADSLGIPERIIQVPRPGNELLEALYNCAAVFLYPSRFEGFGWPIIEAQACGCPVVCSSAGPMAEVAGDSALLHVPDDEEGFAADLVRLLDPEEQIRWSRKALENAKRFTATRMISDYRDLYRSLAPTC